MPKKPNPSADPRTMSDADFMRCLRANMTHNLSVISLGEMIGMPMDAKTFPRDFKDAIIVSLGGTPPPRNRSDVVVGDEVNRALDVRDGAGRSGGTRTMTQAEGIVNEFDSALDVVGQQVALLHDRVMKLGGLPPPKEGGDAGSDPEGETFMSRLNIRLKQLRRHGAMLAHIVERVNELV